MSRNRNHLGAGLFVILTITAALLAAEARAETSAPPDFRAFDYVVAQKLTSGGLAAPSSSNTHGVRVLSSGMVIAVRGKATRMIAQLTPVQQEQLQTQIEAIRENMLIDTDPQRPHCADAPETIYTVRAEESARDLKIATILNCHQFILNNLESQQIREFLDQLDDFYSRAPF